MRWAPLIITSLFVSLLVMARVADIVPESWWPSDEIREIGDHETTEHTNPLANETYRIQALTWFGTGKQCAVKGVQIVRLNKASETADEQPIFFRIAARVIEPGAGSFSPLESIMTD
tara:strand:+ start:1536 stop:1886 length:351 start_codon:yes stop_codon:yes gene_type:complete